MNLLCDFFYLNTKIQICNNNYVYMSDQNNEIMTVVWWTRQCGVMKLMILDFFLLNENAETYILNNC
jgi:hypothetical protein